MGRPGRVVSISPCAMVLPSVLPSVRRHRVWSLDLISALLLEGVVVTGTYSGLH